MQFLQRKYDNLKRISDGTVEIIAALTAKGDTEEMVKRPNLRRDDSQITIDESVESVSKDGSVKPKTPVPKGKHQL